MRLSQNDAICLAILKDLETFRKRMESGEINPGCADWVVRFCQAIVADYTQFKGSARKTWEEMI